MIELILFPIRKDVELSVVENGDLLIINSEVFDISRLQEGETLPRSAIDSSFICGDVMRLDGNLSIPLSLPHAFDTSHAARFPRPITITKNGPVELPK